MFRFYTAPLTVALCLAVLAVVEVGARARSRPTTERSEREGQRRCVEEGTMNGGTTNMPCYRADSDGQVLLDAACAEGFECVDSSERARPDGPVTRFCRSLGCEVDADCDGDNTCRRGHCTVSQNQAVFGTACLIQDDAGNEISSRQCPPYHTCDTSRATTISHNGQELSAFKCRQGN